ncbi:MAG: carboxypeptidase-like regulatory domain-containing protein [Gemmatimonadetes bacterium]|nr:carboxypeptidase-like regulatory domain-containing protein [Gemmatimonadota bacterium]
MSRDVLRSLARSLLSTGLALAIASPLAAQATGSVRGRVIVEGANRPLPQAQVGVVGTAIGAQTNENGEYRLSNARWPAHDSRRAPRLRPRVGPGERRRRRDGDARLRHP